MFSLQEEVTTLKKKIQTLEHDLQSAHKLHVTTKNKLEEEALNLRKKLRDTEAKYSNLAATPPKVSQKKEVEFLSNHCLEHGDAPIKCNQSGSGRRKKKLTVDVVYCTGAKWSIHCVLILL